MGRDFPPALAAQRIAPPLQPDLARTCLAGGLADAGDFQIERVERKQRGPMLGGSKQGGEKTVLIREPDEPLAMGKCILHRVAVSASVTAWRSMSSLSLPLPQLPCALSRRRDRSGWARR